MDSKTKAAHEQAVKEGAEYYLDPETGYLVFTELAHLKRGACCGSGCRHCPFDGGIGSEKIKS